LGLALSKAAQQSINPEEHQLILISANASQVKDKIEDQFETENTLFFDAFLNMDEDRHRLIALLKDKNIQIETFIYN
jgi:hypothetical protein